MFSLLPSWTLSNIYQCFSVFKNVHGIVRKFKSMGKNLSTVTSLSAMTNTFVKPSYNSEIVLLNFLYLFKINLIIFWPNFTSIDLTVTIYFGLLLSLWQNVNNVIFVIGPVIISVLQRYIFDPSLGMNWH